MRREISLDTWRGLMLILMAVAHLEGRLGEAVRYQLGFLSSAEGFVFLSGVMCGLVYARYSRTSMRLMFERLWRRALTIYSYHVAVLLILFGYVTALALIAPGVAPYFEQTDLSVFLDRPFAGLIVAMLCLLLPKNIGILGIYVVYVAVAPLILALFIKGRAGLVFAASGLIWLFAQFGGGVAVARMLPGHDLMVFGAFDVFGWQLVFVAGCYIGWRRADGKELLSERARPLFFAAAAATLAFFIIRHWGPALGRADLGGANSLARVGWLRVINTAAFALTVYGVARFYGFELRIRFAALLGAHSLQVFCFHALIIYFAYPVLWRLYALGLGAELVAATLFVASLGVPAVLHARHRAMVSPRLAAA